MLEKLLVQARAALEFKIYTQVTQLKHDAADNRLRLSEHWATELRTGQYEMIKMKLLSNLH